MAWTSAERAWFSKTWSDTCAEQLCRLLDDDIYRALGMQEKVRLFAETVIEARRVIAEIEKIHPDRTDPQLS